MLPLVTNLTVGEVSCVEYCEMVQWKIGNGNPKDTGLERRLLCFSLKEAFKKSNMGCRSPLSCRKLLGCQDERWTMEAPEVIIVIIAMVVRSVGNNNS